MSSQVAKAVGSSLAIVLLLIASAAAPRLGNAASPGAADNVAFSSTPRAMNNLWTSANHVAGAIYRGSMRDSSSGTIQFVVSRDGKRVTSLRTTAPRSVLCELFPSGFELLSRDIPIRNHKFNSGEFAKGSYVGLFYGSFSDAQSADGFFRIGLPGPLYCQNESWFWTAAAMGPAPPCIVPKVTGKALEAAEGAIEKAHCKTGKIRRAFSPKVRKERVISQRPAPGTRLEWGSSVNLVVSRGRRR